MTNTVAWVLFIAFVPLLIIEEHIIRHKHSRGGVVFFFYALLTFQTWNVLSTWWIGYVSITGMLIISVINSFLMAGVWWMVHTIRRTFDTRTAYFSLFTFWLSFEYLHFHWSMQWPWLTLGNGFAGVIKWIQWYEFTGVLGGSLWILLVNVILYSSIKCLKKKLYQQSIKMTAIVFLLIALPMCWSLYRYNTYTESKNHIKVAVLQPNIDPYKDKFGGMTYEEQEQRLITLAQHIIDDSIQYVLAPETALGPLWENDSMRNQMGLRMLDTLFVKHPRLTLIAGAITQKKIIDGKPFSYAARRSEQGEFYEVYNSALFINDSPEVKIGHKSILVSGVEKIPFQEYIPFLGKFVVDAGGTSGSLSAAAQPTVFKGFGVVGIGTVICFESAFGGFVTNSVRNGANVLFVITNDGWWKESAGLTQHFSYSRLRAVETRRSIARSANTGLSGFINEKGDVIKMTNSNTITAIRASLTINNVLTFYVRHGDYLGWICAVLAVLIGVYLVGRRIWSDQGINDKRFQI